MHKQKPLHKSFFIFIFFLYYLLVLSELTYAQEPKDSIRMGLLSMPGQSDVLNESVDFIPPTPEAGSLFRAARPAVNEPTGSPDISIHLGQLVVPGYTLDLSLKYHSIGIRVDDYASMAGMGWDLAYGGVISRTVMHMADEHRTPGNNNLTVPEYSLRNAAVSSTNYGAGTLAVVINRNENWVSGKPGTVEEFSDHRGLLILRRIWESTSKNTMRSGRSLPPVCIRSPIQVVLPHRPQRTLTRPLLPRTGKNVSELPGIPITHFPSHH